MCWCTTVVRFTSATSNKGRSLKKHRIKDTLEHPVFPVKARPYFPEERSARIRFGRLSDCASGATPLKYHRNLFSAAEKRNDKSVAINVPRCCFNNINGGEKTGKYFLHRDNSSVSSSGASISKRKVKERNATGTNSAATAKQLGVLGCERPNER